MVWHTVYWCKCLRILPPYLFIQSRIHSESNCHPSIRIVLNREISHHRPLCLTASFFQVKQALLLSLLSTVIKTTTKKTKLLKNRIILCLVGFSRFNEHLLLNFEAGSTVDVCLSLLIPFYTSSSAIPGFVGVRLILSILLQKLRRRGVDGVVEIQKRHKHYG